MANILEALFHRVDETNDLVVAVQRDMESLFSDTQQATIEVLNDNAVFVQDEVRVELRRLILKARRIIRHLENIERDTEKVLLEARARDVANQEFQREVLKELRRLKRRTDGAIIIQHRRRRRSSSSSSSSSSGSSDDDDNQPGNNASFQANTANPTNTPHPVNTVHPANTNQPSNNNGGHQGTGDEQGPAAKRVRFGEVVRIFKNE